LSTIAADTDIAAAGLEIGIGRRARRAYGFDEVALVPGRITINPDEVDISFRLGDLRLELPIWGSAMDGVVDVDFAIAMGRLGGIAVLNLDGVQTKYDDPVPVIRRIAEASRAEVNALLQEVYREPVKARLVEERIRASPVRSPASRPGRPSGRSSSKRLGQTSWSSRAPC
jgi:IMP dehydrogenase